MAVFNIHIHALDLSAFLVFSAPPVFSARPETSYGAVACLATCKRRPGSSQPTPEYVVDKKKMESVLWMRIWKIVHRLLKVVNKSLKIPTYLDTVASNMPARAVHIPFQLL